MFDLHPSLDLHLTRNITVSADWDFFWRYSTDDGIYDAGGFVLRPGDGDAASSVISPASASRGRSIGTPRSTSPTAHFFAGDYIK